MSVRLSVTTNVSALTPVKCADLRPNRRLVMQNTFIVNCNVNTNSTYKFSKKARDFK